MLIQMTKKMIEFLISGYEYYENERKSRHNEKNLVDKPGKSDILNTEEKKPCGITVLFSHGFLENRG